MGIVFVGKFNAMASKLRKVGKIKSTSEVSTKVKELKLSFRVAMPPICHRYTKYY